jgi:hypothetical protein
LWFWEGERRTAQSGFYLRVTPDLVAIGVGANHLDRAGVDHYRRAVCDEAAGPELVRIVVDLEGDGWELRAPRRARPPRGWRPEDPDAARLLQDDGVFIVRSEPAQLATDARRLVPACVEVWSALAPLHRWLVEHVQYATVA